LAMGMGVASAGAVLAGYNSYFQTSGTEQTLKAFHATFATMGLMTLASAWIFWQLAADERGKGQVGTADLE